MEVNLESSKLEWIWDPTEKTLWLEDEVGELDIEIVGFTDWDCEKEGLPALRLKYPEVAIPDIPEEILEVRRIDLQDMIDEHFQIDFGEKCFIQIK